MDLLHSTLLYITLQQVYFTPLDSTAFYHILNSVLVYIIYHGSTSFYFALPYPRMAVLHSTLFTLHYSTMAVLHSTLHYSTIALLHSVLLYITMVE